MFWVGPKPSRLTCESSCFTNVYMKIKGRTKAGTTILAVRVPVKLKNRLEGLARSTASSRSRLAAEALESYVDEQESQLARIDQGIRDADAGRVVPHEEVKRYLQSWGRKRKLPLPVCNPYANRLDRAGVVGPVGGRALQWSSKGHRPETVWQRISGRAWNIWRSFRTWASRAAGPEQGLLSSLLL